MRRRWDKQQTGYGSMRATAQHHLFNDRTTALPSRRGVLTRGKGETRNFYELADVYATYESGISGSRVLLFR